MNFVQSNVTIYCNVFKNSLMFAIYGYFKYLNVIEHTGCKVLHNVIL